MPQKAAGCRTEPPVSEPSAPAHNEAATAATEHVALRAALETIRVSVAQQVPGHLGRVFEIGQVELLEVVDALRVLTDVHVGPLGVVRRAPQAGKLTQEIFDYFDANDVPYKRPKDFKLSETFNVQLDQAKIREDWIDVFPPASSPHPVEVEENGDQRFFRLRGAEQQ